MSVTLQSIADEVGLSVMTVSRALRGVSRINPQTRQQIRQVAGRMGYLPLQGVLFAPSTKSGKASHQLKVLLPTVNHRLGADGGSWWLDRMTKAILERLEISNGTMVEQHFPDIESLLDSCKKQRYHGVILRQPFPQKWVEELRNVTAVVYGVEFDHQLGVDSVYSNEHRSAAQILDTVGELKHRSIAWFGILDRYAPYQVIFDDMDATCMSDCQAFTVHGARHAAWANSVYCQFEPTVKQHLILEKRDWRSEDLSIVVNRGMDHIMTLPEKPTVIVCSCDPLAVAVARWLQEKGYMIPGDFSLISYGGSEELALIEPQISSIQMPMETIGKVIPELIERRLADPDATPISIQFEAFLNRTQSLAAPDLAAPDL